MYAIMMYIAHNIQVQVIISIISKLTDHLFHNIKFTSIFHPLVTIAIKEKNTLCSQYIGGCFPIAENKFTLYLLPIQYTKAVTQVLVNTR
jgi:hypothetical protein